jgi:hypothetical protein
MLGKSSNDRLFALQWEAAIKAISNAAQIWVMGYSFPITDAFMSRLLTEGIMSNQDFRRLTVVDLARAEKHGVNNLLARQMKDKQFRYLQLPVDGVIATLSIKPVDGWLSVY